MTEKKEEPKKEPECSSCGLCRTACPIFKVMLTETDSPRGKAILLNKDTLNELFYKCTLCGRCKLECPVNFNLGVAKVREKVVKRVETKANKKMIENLRKYNNPFGKLKKGEKIKDLYCC
ncbi:MAG: (Fe-S)-binding protein [bacterium]|nr:(Fe-S)-binding protein [bacterium]